MAISDLAMAKTLVEPKQKRAKKTYEALLNAAQEILAENGLEALNSNAIVAKAGATAPSFYRYFQNKYSVLSVLGHRLMALQNDIVVKTLADTNLDKNIVLENDKIFKMLHILLADTYLVTQNMTGAGPLLIALRAIPQLSPIRIESHAMIAKATADQIVQLYPNSDPIIALHKARLASEYGYAAVELLLEVPALQADIILKAAAQSVYDLLISDTN